MLRQIAAEESILQMATMPALVDLVRFHNEPTDMNESRLLGIPALYKVLKFDRQIRGDGRYSPEILGVCGWIITRATDVASRLITGSDDIEKPMAVNEDRWQEVSSLVISLCL